MKTSNAIRLLLAAATSAALPTATLAATPEVTSVAMAQSSMSRLVTITYTLANAPAVVTLDVQTNANTSAAANDPGWTSIGGEAVCNAQGDVWKKVAPELTEGNSFNGTITWRPDLSWPDHKIASGGARAVVTAWALDNTPDYMVVDVSAGAQPNTQKYYPSVEFFPGGILSNQNYRTTKLVMRKIMAKDVEWTMGSTSMESQRETAREATHQVTLTNNYYIGDPPNTTTSPTARCAPWSKFATTKSATPPTPRRRTPHTTGLTPPIPVPSSESCGRRRDSTSTFRLTRNGSSPPAPATATRGGATVRPFRIRTRTRTSTSWGATSGTVDLYGTGVPWQDLLTTVVPQMAQP